MFACELAEFNRRRKVLTKELHQNVQSHKVRSSPHTYQRYRTPDTRTKAALSDGAMLIALRNG